MEFYINLIQCALEVLRTFYSYEPSVSVLSDHMFIALYALKTEAEIFYLYQDK